MKLTEKELRKVLNRQKKTEEILACLPSIGKEANERTWRTFVRRYNNEFDLHDTFIASDINGYYLTTSKKKITRNALNRFRNGLSMMQNAKQDLQILSEKNQLSLMEEDADLFDMVMKMEI